MYFFNFNTRMTCFMVLVFCSERKIMHMFLPYILMWSPLWVSCFFQRSSPSVNAHIAASECRASSGGEPAGRAKHRGIIHGLIRLYGNPCFFMKKPAPLWRTLLTPHQTTAEFPCCGRSCCSSRCCFCWKARPTVLPCPSLWQDIWSSW